MNNIIMNLLFFIIVFFVIFNNIPVVMQIHFISGILQSKLIFYPIFISLLYILYCQYKYKNIFVNFDKFLKFIVVYLGGIMFL